MFSVKTADMHHTPSSTKQLEDTVIVMTSLVDNEERYLVRGKMYHMRQAKGRNDTWVDGEGIFYSKSYFVTPAKFRALQLESVFKQTK